MKVIDWKPFEVVIMQSVNCFEQRDVARIHYFLTVFVISQPTLVFYPCFPHWIQVDVAQLETDDLKSDPITQNIATFEPTQS